jgi:hypothetical protein
MVNIQQRESWNADALLYWKSKGSVGYVHETQHAEETTSLGAIFFNPHAIVEDWELSFVTTIVQLNWGNSIVTVEKVREPMLDVDLAWM